MVTLEEMEKALHKNVIVKTVNNKKIKGYCPYVMPKEPGEDEEDSIFIDAELKYCIGASRIKTIEILD